MQPHLANIFERQQAEWQQKLYTGTLLLKMFLDVGTGYMALGTLQHSDARKVPCMQWNLAAC